MRILLINKFHYLKGGAERAYFDTARILSENGHTVAFFSMEHPENLETPWSRFFVTRSEYLEEGKGQSISEQIKLAFKILWNFEAQKKLDALIKEFKPDIAHLHNTYHQLSPSIIWTLKKQRVPIVMTLHDYKLASPNYNLYVRGRIWEHASGLRCLVDRCVKDSYLKSAVCVLEKWLHGILGTYGKVDHYIAPSQFLIDEMKKLGFPYRIQKIAQPIVPFPTEPVSSKGEYLLFVGRLSSEKGVSVLLEAMRGLPTEKLTVVGDGPDKKSLEETKTKFHLENVDFVGTKYNEDLTNLVREAKAVIVPSVWFENMPYVVLEALAQGKPVIASRLGGMVERIHEGKNGFLFEVGNPDSLIHAIQKLTQIHSESIALDARESVQDLHAESYFKALESLYSELLPEVKT